MSETPAARPEKNREEINQQINRISTNLIKRAAALPKKGNDVWNEVPIGSGETLRTSGQTLAVVKKKDGHQVDYSVSGYGELEKTSGFNSARKTHDSRNADTYRGIRISERKAQYSASNPEVGFTELNTDLTNKQIVSAAANILGEIRDGVAKAEIVAKPPEKPLADTEKDDFIKM